MHGTASWELVPPELEEIRRRMEGIVEKGFPYFVATIDGQVVGYSYASSYRTRPGYRFIAATPPFFFSTKIVSIIPPKPSA